MRKKKELTSNEKRSIAQKARWKKIKLGNTGEKPIYMHGSDIPQGKYQLADIPAQIPDSERIQRLEAENRKISKKLLQFTSQKSAMYNIARINEELANVIRNINNMIDTNDF